MARLYTYQQAAEELNVSVGWLKKQVWEGTVPFRKLGDLTRFSNADLDAIAGREAYPAGKKQPRSKRKPRAQK